MSAPTEGLEALLPCPFCGEEPYLHEPSYHGDQYQIGCDACVDDSECKGWGSGALWRNGQTYEDAAKMWNRRTALQASPAGRETDAAWCGEVACPGCGAYLEVATSEDGEGLSARNLDRSGLEGWCAHTWAGGACIQCGERYDETDPEPASLPDGEVGGAS